MALSKIDPAGLDIGQIGGRRNLIINGAMQVAQRGTSQASVSNGYSTADRWRTFQSTIGAFTQSVESDAPDGFAKSLKMNCTTAEASLGSADRLWVDQKLEGQDLQSFKYGSSSAQDITLSFYAKTNVTGTYIVMLYASSGRSVSQSYTIDASATWEYKTITFSGDTTGTFTANNAEGLDIRFFLAAGSNYTSGTLSTDWSSTVNANTAVGQTNLASATSNYWQITGVQLEVGSVATPFEHRSYGEELALCERYYHRWTAQSLYGNIAIGYSAGSGVGRGLYCLPTTMRTTPSLASNGNFRCINDGGTYGGSVSSIAISRTHTRTPFIQFNTSGLPSGDYQPVEMGADNDADAYIDFDAEL